MANIVDIGSVSHGTIEQAKLKAQRGMEQALAHADSATLHELAAAPVHPEDFGHTWAELAHAFLCRYARRHRTFTAEECTKASIAWGMIQPPTTRAWGQIYRNAARKGIIVQAGIGRSLGRHYSICPLWRSTIYRDAA